MTASDSKGIAIIGMTGRFPGAPNVDEFWRNLVAGVESISTFTDEELAASGLDVATLKKNRNYVAARGILQNAEWFDAAFFGMSANEAAVTDPQQRLLMEAAWEVLENAGYDPEQVDAPIGVYAGMGGSSYYLNHLHFRPDLVDLVGEKLISFGNEKDYLATRIAYKLNLKGPAMNINTACSTSLVAVCQACQGLLTYQCDLALAGGASLTFPQKSGVRYQEGGIFSPDGHCRPFDARAQGTVSSEGIGIVLLKRVAEAIDDGDPIYAVIKGFGLNNDGSAKVGFTAPSVDGQAEAIVTAQAQAGFDPATISYVEAHSTATPLGDPIEFAALTQAFRVGTEEKNFCAIGSVKSNIGHPGAAAGVASLIKTALALKNRMLPPSLHYTEPNPKIDFADSPFFVNSKLTEWKSGPTPRRAGVSSFGLGGTNAHLVLEEAPAPESSGPSRSDQLLLFSAKTASALDAVTANFLACLKANPDINLADAAYTLQVGRRAFPHRRMLVCRDRDDAIQALETCDPKRVITQKAEPNGQMMPSTLSPSQDQDTSAMLTTLGKLWLAGKSVDWSGIHAHERRHRISLPTYPFQREQYWIEPRIPAFAAAAPSGFSQTMRHARPEVTTAFTPPTTGSERALAGIWQNLFGIQEVGIDDNFFELGGNSLLAVQLIGNINKSLNFHFSIPVFFQNPTIKKLATVLDQEYQGESKPDSAQKSGSATRLVTFQANGSRPPLFFLHGDWAGGGLYCGRLSQQLGEDQPFYSLPPYRSGKSSVLNLEEMVAYHLAIIREHTPHGPYLLGGYCAGATIAMEIARQLVEQGEKVPHLLLLELPQRSVSWLHKVWPYVDKGGDSLKWDLLKKIHFFDRYPVSLTRWLSQPPRSKVTAIGRRLGLTTAGSSSPVTMGIEAGAYDGEIVKSLDYAVYFLAACLYSLRPLSIPTTLYFSEETLPRSFRVKRAREIFPMGTVEMVPGNHLTCITKYASVLADKMEKTLGSLAGPLTPPSCEEQLLIAS